MTKFLFLFFALSRAEYFKFSENYSPIRHKTAEKSEYSPDKIETIVKEMYKVMQWDEKTRDRVLEIGTE